MHHHHQPNTVYVPMPIPIFIIEKMGRIQGDTRAREPDMTPEQKAAYAGSLILLTIALATSDPLFLRGQLGGLFGGNGNNDRSAHQMTNRYANAMSGQTQNQRSDRFANGAGFMGGHHGGAHGGGFSGGGGGGDDFRGGGFSGGNRYGDHHGSGHFGGHPHMHYGYGAGMAYGHGGGGGNYGHGDGGGMVEYNGGVAGVNALGGTGGGLKAGLKSLLFGMKGRMKSAYLNMKKALKAMFHRGELGDGNTNVLNNYAGNYGYDRTKPGRRVAETIEFGRTGQTFLRIGWKPQSSYGGWPSWLKFLG